MKNKNSFFFRNFKCKICISQEEKNEDILLVIVVNDSAVTCNG